MEKQYAFTLLDDRLPIAAERKDADKEDSLLWES